MKDIIENDGYNIHHHISAITENLLISSGFNPTLLGYGYIIKAVEIYFDSSLTLSDSKTKLLYPEIAKQCNTGARNVERNIRTAIKNAWVQNCGNHFYLRVGSLKSESKRPTCGELIALIVQYIENIEFNDGNIWW